jgi:hypothetical protein
VVGVVLLVVVAFVVVLLQPDPEYQPEDAAEDVVHNYLLALKKGEYERAYSYIYSYYRPEDVEEFVEDINNNCRWNFIDLERDTTQIVEPAQVTGKRATVKVEQSVFYSGELFDSGQRRYDIKMSLLTEDGKWKIVDGDEYWCHCWDEVNDWCD